MTVMCLLLLPATSSAGGLGDLFSGDIVDKIKSIPIKDILMPSEKSEDSDDPAPSQKNSSPTAAVAETKENKPAKVPASPAVAKEAEGVKAWCYEKPPVRSNHDCECVADRFIVERQGDPVAGKDVLLSRILTVNKCPNLEGIRANKYKECIVGSGTPGFNTGGHEVEAYCQCVGKRTAKSISGHKGKLGPGRRGSYDRNALAYCSKAEAYR
jgi:hypothetical protein